MKKNIFKKSSFVVIIIILIVIISYQLISNFNNYINIKMHDTLINNFLEYDSVNNLNNFESYIAVIEIPKINLRQELYDLDSLNNDVNKHIEILHGSDMPNVMNGNLILAGHSGNSKISYFKNLNELIIGDVTTIYYQNVKYSYKIVNIYKADKTGYVEITRNKNKSVVTLITCDKKDKNKQLVIIAELDSFTNY